MANRQNVPKTVVDLIAATAKALSAQMEVALGLPHYGESGRALEDTLREVLARHLPGRFMLRSGFAVGTDGQFSPQSDILVVDALASPTFLSTPGAGVYPADGVIGCIEVTRNLTTKKVADDATKLSVLGGLQRAFTFPQLNTQPVCLLVGASSNQSLEDLGRAVRTTWQAVPPAERAGRLPHGLLVLDRGLVCYGKRVGGSLIVSFDPSGADDVFLFEKTPEHLALFLHLLTNELGYITEHRSAAAGFHILTSLSPMMREHLKDGWESAMAFPKTYEKVKSIMPAAALSGHVIRFAYYFGEALMEQLLPFVRPVKA
jgi:hypothetical protein